MLIEDVQKGEHENIWLEIKNDWHQNEREQNLLKIVQRLKSNKCFNIQNTNVCFLNEVYGVDHIIFFGEPFKVYITIESDYQSKKYRIREINSNGEFGSTKLLTTDLDEVVKYINGM